MLALILAAAVATAGSSSSSSASAPTVVSQAVVKAGAAAGPEQVICRNEEVAGTRLTQRVCTTAAQRQANELYIRRYVRDLEESSGMNASAMMSSGAPRPF